MPRPRAFPPRPCPWPSAARLQQAPSVEWHAFGCRYKYLVLDDGWADMDRTLEGRLQGDRTRFPSGRTAAADLLPSAPAGLA